MKASRGSPDTTGSPPSWRASYHTRFLVALAGTLLLIVTLVHLPIHRTAPRMGWRVAESDERIHLQELMQETEASEGAPQVAHHDVPPTVHVDPAPAEPPQEPVADARPPADSSPEPDEDQSGIYHLSALGPAADRPRIVGGAGNFFLRINYPEEARRQGIEGRVILDFVVDTEGRTRDVTVHKSLHPLCDSAAVRALRDTRFVPGRRAGEPVPVRMRLPVRFRLLGATNQSLATDNQESSGGS